MFEAFEANFDEGYVESDWWLYTRDEREKREELELRASRAGILSEGYDSEEEEDTDKDLIWDIGVNELLRDFEGYWEEEWWVNISFHFLEQFQAWPTAEEIEWGEEF